MILHFKNQKEKRGDLKFMPTGRQAGMTYIELIVVLGIFFAFGSFSIANYRTLQGKVALKTLASDVALKIVEAQKNALSGKFTAGGITNWKPSYGVYFSLSPSPIISFKSFADLDQSKTRASNEDLETFDIKKGNKISELKIVESCSTPPCTSTIITTNPVNVTFTRPDGSATICSTDFQALCPVDPNVKVVDYLQITLQSPDGSTTPIKLYASGRVQLN